MFGQTPAAYKLLARAYHAVLRRMWLKNVTCTVMLSAAMLGGVGIARADDGYTDPDTFRLGSGDGDSGTQADPYSPVVEPFAYGNTPDPDGSYGSMHPVNLGGVFASPTPSPIWRNLGSQRGVFYYFHAVGGKTMDEEMTGGISWHTRLAQVADAVRSYYASASGGQLDIRYDIIDVPLPAQANGQPWGSTLTSGMPVVGDTLNNYTFVASYYGPGTGSLITNPNTAQGSGGLASIGGVGTGQIQSWQNGTNISAVIHETGHNMGLSHSRSMETNGTTPTYTYDYASNAYVSTTGMGSGPIRQLPIGSSYTEYGNPYSLMGAYPPDNSLTPRQKQAAGWLTQKNFANLNALNPAGGTNTVKIYDDMVDHTVVTNGQTGDALRYGVSMGYGDTTYGAYLVRPADNFHVTPGANPTGKWQAYMQTLDFYYRSHSATYEGIETASSNSAGIVVTLGGAYIGVLTAGQSFLEKDFNQSLFMPTGGGGVGSVPGYNLDDGTSYNNGNSNTPIDITAYGTTRPLNPNRYRNIWYKLTYLGNGADGLGHWANLQVESFTGAQVVGWQWDASPGSGNAGAQDGSGTWTTGAGNWRSVSMSLDDQNWTAGEDAVFGSGNGAAGTVTLGGNISVNSIAFKAAGSGNYTISGNGNTLTIDVGGINTESSATIAAPVTLSAQQLWSVSVNQTLNVTGVITPGTAHTLYKAGQGVLALGGANNWTSQLQVGEGTVRQDANQTFSANLLVGEAGVYLVNAGTLAMASGRNISGMTYGPLDGIQLDSLGTLELGSSGSTSTNPDLNFLGSSTVAVLVQVDAGTHHLNGAASTVNITGALSGNGTLVKQGAGTLLLSGANTFTGNLTLTAGTLVLNARTAVDGVPSLTITGGTFQLSSAFTGGVATVGSLSGANGIISTYNDGGNGIRTLAVKQTADGVYGGTLTDEGFGLRQLSLNKQGSARLTLSGNNTYSGGTRISEGTLQIGNGGSSGALGAGSIVNNATLAFNRTGSGHVVLDVISGTGALEQNGTATLTLYSENTYTGATRINAGILKAATANAFGVNSAITLANTAGTALALNNYAQSVGSIAGGGATGGNITLGSATLTTGGDNTTTAYAGVISGTGGLTKVGTGNQTLSGKNTYTGATTVVAGTLTADFSAVGAPTADIIAPGSALVMNGGTMAFKGAAGATNTQTFSGTTITAGASTLALIRNGATSLDVQLGLITQNSGGTINFTGTTGAAVGARFLTGTGTAGALLDGGAQWAMVDGANWAAKDASNNYIVAYTGYADVPTNGGFVPNSSAANVRITEGGAGTNPLAAATTSVNSLLMSAGTTAATVLTAGKMLAVGRTDTGGIAVAQGAQSLTLGAAANDGVLTVGSTATAKTLSLVSNNTSAAQGLVVNTRIQDNAANGVVSLAVSGGAGAGTVILAGDNTYTGTTAVTNDGTLQVGNGGTTGKLGSGAVTVSGGATLAFNRSDAVLVVANTISGAGNLTQSGAGKTTLIGANTYSGLTTISAGTLQVGSGGSVGTLGVGAVVDNGALAFNRSDSITVANAISGTGTLTQSGSGTTLLTGANSYSGATTVSAGILQVGDGGTSGTLGIGAVVNNASLVLNRSGTLAVAGDISGTGTLTQSGSGTAILAGTNSYSGLTTISAGTLQIGGGGSSGTLGSGTVTNNAALVFNRSDSAPVVTGAISGTGTLTQAGAGTTTLAGANTYTGTTLLNNGTLRVGNGGASGTIGTGAVVMGGGTLEFNRSDTLTVGSLISGDGYLAQSGSGTTILTADNTYFGKTTINAGSTLQIGNGGTSGRIGGGTIVDNGTLVFNRSDSATFVGAISGTGALTQAGTGTLAIVTANTYTGATVIRAGTISANKIVVSSGNSSLGNATSSVTLGSATDQGTLSYTGNGATYTRGFTIDAGGGRLDVMTAGQTLTVGTVGVTGTGLFTVGGAGNTKITAALSNTGGLTKVDGGTLTLTNGANSHTGLTTVAGGTLACNTTGAIGTGAVTVSGGTLNLAGFGNDSVGVVTLVSGSITGTTGTLTGSSYAVQSGSISKTLAGTGTLTKTTAGTVILSGANTYTGITAVSAGTLLLNGANAFGAGSRTVGDGGILGGTGSFTGTGTTTVNAGGTLRGGDGTAASGALTVGGGVTLASGSVIQLALGASLTHSTIAHTTGTAFVFDGTQTFSFLDFGATTGTYQNLITGVANSGSTLGWTIANAGWLGTFQYDGSGNIDLVLNAVPEPSTYGLLGAGALAFTALARRRRKSAS